MRKKKNRTCRDCGNDISNLRWNCKRCKSCQWTHRHNRYMELETELRKQFGWIRRKSRINRLGTADMSSHICRDKNGNPDFEAEARSVRSIKRMFLYPNLKKGINLLSGEEIYYIEESIK